MQELSIGVATSDPYLVAIIKAQDIYHAIGKSVWPWEIDDLPSDWKQALKAIASDYPKARAAYKELNDG